MSTQPNNPQIQVTINLYGDTVLNSAAFGALSDENSGSLLGIFGGVDPSIPLEEVEAFDNTLTEAGVEHTITVYDEMGHAFIQPDAISQLRQAQDTWQQIIDYLNTNL